MFKIVAFNAIIHSTNGEVRSSPQAKVFAELYIDLGLTEYSWKALLQTL